MGPFIAALVACGGMAATPKRAEKVERALAGASRAGIDGFEIGYPELAIRRRLRCEQRLIGSAGRCLRFRARHC